LTHFEYQGFLLSGQGWVSGNADQADSSFSGCEEYAMWRYSPRNLLTKFRKKAGKILKQTINLGAYGWRHGRWSGTFYPDDLPMADDEDWRLAYYSNEFNAVMVPADY